MNRNSWEAAKRSSAFGLELHNPFYEQLKAVTHAAMEAEGLSLDGLNDANDAVIADAERTKALNEERKQKIRADKISNSLFLTAAIGLLPPVSLNYDYTNPCFTTVDREQAYSILDSVIWFGKEPYWMAGYRYTDNSALCIPASPTKDYYSRQHSDTFSSLRHYFPYAGFNKPYKDELSFSFDGSTLDHIFDKKAPKASLRFTKMPSSLRPFIQVAPAYTYMPSRKDRKAFKHFGSNDARLETMQNVAKTYNPVKRAFVINSDAPKVYEPRDNYINVEGCDPSDNNMVSTDTMSHYNVFDGLVRLMSRFDKGTEYLDLMERAKNNDIETAVMEQQGIPILDSKEKVEAYFREKYESSYTVLNPKQVDEATGKFWDNFFNRD